MSDTARVLAERGADVVLAVRDITRGEAAAGRMEGGVEVRRLDLADLASVREFAASAPERIDVLIRTRRPRGGCGRSART